MSIPSKLERGRALLESNTETKSWKVPSPPLLQAIPAMNVSSVFDACASNIPDLGDSPYMFEQRMYSILTSDHPMLLEAIKKLYVLGKLCLPADDHRVLSAQKIENDLLRQANEIRERNETKTRDYEINMNDHITRVNATNTKMIVWWNEFIKELEPLLDATRKNSVPSRLPVRLGQFVNVVKTQLNQFGIPAGWYKERPSRLAELFTIPVTLGIADEAIKANRYWGVTIRTILTNYDAAHKTFINVAIRDIRAQLNHDPRVIAEAESTAKDREFYSNCFTETVWAYMAPRKGFNSCKYPEKPEIVRRTSADHLARIQQEFDNFVDQLVQEELSRRKHAGIDGYDCLYPDENTRSNSWDWK